MKRPGFTAKSSLPDLAQPKAASSAELFANDGSFLEKFLQIQGMKGIYKLLLCTGHLARIHLVSLTDLKNNFNYFCYVTLSLICTKSRVH